MNFRKLHDLDDNKIIINLDDISNIEHHINSTLINLKRRSIYSSNYIRCKETVGEVYNIIIKE